MKARKPIYALAVASIVSLLSGCSCGNNQTHVHNYVEHQKVDSTCTSLGNELYYGCSGCDLLFSDNKGTVIESIPVIEKKAHNYTKEDHDDKYLKEPATCSNKAKYYYSCVGCGDKGEESFEYGEYAEHPKEDTKWYRDEINHYHKTSCEHHVGYDYSLHTYNSDGVCETCGNEGESIIHDTTEYEASIKKAGTIDLSNYIDTKTEFEVEPIVGSDTTYTISTGGTYVLQGEFKQGIQISTTDKVQIYLNGVTINNDSGVAIGGSKDLNVTLTAVSGTTNIVTNNGTDVNAIHIKGKLVINGSGTLNVTSSSKTAIKCSKTLRIIGPSINVLGSINHGIAAESVEIEDTTIDVKNCLKDGINAEYEEDAFKLSKGYVSLKNVKYTCSVNGDGIQANSFVYIDGGTYNITTTGEYVEDTEENRTKYGLTDKDFVYKLVKGKYVPTSSGKYALTSSCRGIKVEEKVLTSGERTNVYCIFVNAGDLTINSTDSSLYVEYGNIIVKDGTFNLESDNVGLSAYFDTIIYNGTINIKSNECIESSYINIKDGNIDLYAYDDGINATVRTEVSVPDIIIEGGNIQIKADKSYKADVDAIDSNGRILITGGSIKTLGVVNEQLEPNKGLWINKCELIGYGNTTSSYEALKTSSNNHLLIKGLVKNDVITITKDNEKIFESTNDNNCSKLILILDSLKGDIKVQVNEMSFDVTLKDSFYELNVR